MNRPISFGARVAYDPSQNVLIIFVFRVLRVAMDEKNEN
ncbi:hypothetical protein LEP1GSC062_1461 [Leptospira alexanderi serovar Manhao 3 str. L 60]|uniref:Uncharacterized protein n=1 Tax=Leptospira alexanderi serovar Manhao 3 str. L 60 TaxID=1049759 RepID=V6HTV9_9LEPT|nr:hypothetical protein LEP1GSC062_1461 [Leptospira alexanderi serovar Manhao 3 str. L 60]